MRRCVVLVALALAGCGGGGPTHFYMLAVEPTRAPPAGGACRGAPLTVADVSIPGTLDRQEIVRASGPDELEVSNSERWAAPLDQLIQRTLAQELQARLPQGRVLAPGDPVPPGGQRLVRVNVQRFLADNSGRVTLIADWALLDTNGKPGPSQTETVTVGGASSDSRTAAAMSTALGVLADRIAAKLGSCSS